MCDFNLSDALDSSSDLDQVSCDNMTDVKDETFFRLNEGLNLVVSHDFTTLRSCAYLLLAVNKMKKALTRCGRELRDEELCSAIMESLVTETIVAATESSSAGVNKIFLRINSEDRCTLCDTSKKDVVTSGDLKLQAITLSGGNCERKVTFKLARYMTSSFSSGQSVLLSITNTDLHISCSMEDGKAVLKLEECNVQNLKKISDAGNMDRFLFYKSTQGVSLNTFESVKYPGWFISTSGEDERQAVEMCTVDADNRLMCFNIN
ncbi:interleukin-1 beta [Sebastes umbrosus]|uniref:interleukin-1 beta n=1 Tax=Sebastes umbrosus TaxID=72105 RepID=UPI0018A10D94|nr:interleukin-1 beta [Sebastes umbrosus]